MDPRIANLNPIVEDKLIQCPALKAGMEAISRPMIFRHLRQPQDVIQKKVALDLEPGQNERVGILLACGIRLPAAHYFADSGKRFKTEA